MASGEKGPSTPGEILEISGYYWKTCTLHAAVKLDLFTLIGEKRKTVGDIRKHPFRGPKESGILMGILQRRKH